MNTKKYISPGGWFSLFYPGTWNEFEDAEESFLFYNPTKWTGNFRISVYRGASSSYAKNALADEFKQNPSAQTVKVGVWDCVYSKELFSEDGKEYVTHLWMTGRADMLAECSFTALLDVSTKEAETIIASLELRDRQKRYPKEYIPIRVLEINEINEAFEWATSQIKKKLKKSVSSLEADIDTLQRMIDSGSYTLRDGQALNAFGIVFGTILTNEIDGMEWVSVIDGKQEYPALRYLESQVVVVPGTLISEAFNRDKACHLQSEFEHIKEKIESLLS